jgi:peptidoglycan/xylan/chitin deacetylase (PgdA/CDA1 family)
MLFFKKKLIFFFLLLFTLITIFFLSVANRQNKKSTYVSDAPTKDVVHLSVALPIQTLATTIRVPILMYHYIEHVADKHDTMREKLDITPEVLEGQVKELKAAGYTFLTESDLASILDKKKEAPLKPILLTFDDGYRDFYTNAFPILKKYQAKSTEYIISGFIGRPNNMTLSQLLEISSSGLVEIGAHTQHHIDLQHAPFKQAKEEILGSKTQLEKLLHVPVMSFAYPGGRYNIQSVGIVKDAGFTTAVTTHPGIGASSDNRLTLLRLRPGSRSGRDLIKLLEIRRV